MCAVRPLVCEAALGSLEVELLRSNRASMLASLAGPHPSLAELAGSVRPATWAGRPDAGRRSAGRLLVFRSGGPPTMRHSCIPPPLRSSGLHSSACWMDPLSACQGLEPAQERS